MPSMASTNLEKIRVEKGLTRKDVSVATGVPYNTLKRLELRSSDQVNIQYLKRLADYYNQPLDVAHLLGV